MSFNINAIFSQLQTGFLPATPASGPNLLTICSTFPDDMLRNFAVPIFDEIVKQSPQPETYPKLVKILLEHDTSKTAEDIKLEMIKSMLRVGNGEECVNTIVKILKFNGEHSHSAALVRQIFSRFRVQFFGKPTATMQHFFNALDAVIKEFQDKKVTAPTPKEDHKQEQMFDAIKSGQEIKSCFELFSKEIADTLKQEEMESDCRDTYYDLVQLLVELLEYDASKQAPPKLPSPIDAAIQRHKKDLSDGRVLDKSIVSVFIKMIRVERLNDLFRCQIGFDTIKNLKNFMNDLAAELKKPASSNLEYCFKLCHKPHYSDIKMYIRMPRQQNSSSSSSSSLVSEEERQYIELKISLRNFIDNVEDHLEYENERIREFLLKYRESTGNSRTVFALGNDLAFTAVGNFMSHFALRL